MQWRGRRSVGRLAAGGLALVLAVWMLPVAPAGAAPVHTWVGPAGGLWSNPANWSPAEVPANGDDIVLPASSSSRFDLDGLSVRTLTAAGANPPTTVTGVGGAGLILAGALVKSGPGALELVVPVTLTAGSHSVTVNGGRISFAAPVIGPGGMTLTTTGSARAVFDESSFGGAVDIGASVSVDVNATSLGAPSTGTTIRQGGRLSFLAAGETVIEPVTVAAGTGTVAQLEVDAASLTSNLVVNGPVLVLGTTTITGAISGPGRVILQGASDLLRVTGANTFTGGSEIRGAVAIAGLGPLGTGPIALSGSEASLRLGDGTMLPNDVDLSPGTFTAQSLRLEGVVTIQGTVYAAGTGTVYFQGALDAVVDLVGGVQATSVVAFTRGTYRLGDGSAVSRMVVDGAAIDVQTAAGARSIGTLSIAGNLGTGGVDLHADFQLNPTAGITTGTAFGTEPAYLDLWGTDQVTSSVTIGGGAIMYLGYFDEETPFFGRLTTSSFIHEGRSVEFTLDGTHGDQIRAGAAQLGGGFSFRVGQNQVPVGHSTRLIDNTGSAPTHGRFFNVAEGAEFIAGQQIFRVSYFGGDGNDVTLTRLPGLHSSWGYVDPVDHGGYLVGAPSLSSWGRGRLDGWGVGRDRALWHRWQQDGQSGWERLGGILTSSPAGASQAAGQLDVFARGADNGLWMRSYRNGWGPWISLGGIITEAPAVTSSAPGNLEIVARGGDGGLWLRQMINGVWQPWLNLGGFTTSAPAVTDWGPGELQVFIRGGDGALWQRSLTSSGWSPWRSHGGLIDDGPAVAASAPGQLAVFVRGGDGMVWHRSYEGWGWSSWESLELPTGQRPAATGTSDGYLQLGLRWSDGRLITWEGFQAWTQGASTAGTVSAAIEPAAEHRASADHQGTSAVARHGADPADPASTDRVRSTAR